MKTSLVLALSLGLASLAAQTNNFVASNAAPNVTSVATSTTAPAVPTTATLLEPEWPGQIVALVDGNRLLPLESQQGTIAMKAKGFGFSGGVVSAVYQGSASPVRVLKQEFVVRLAPGDNPENVIAGLLPVTAEKKDRKLVLQSIGGALKGMKISNADSGAVSIRFERYGTASAKIIPAVPLASGEYAFKTSSGVTYLFGVE